MPSLRTSGRITVVMAVSCMVAPLRTVVGADVQATDDKAAGVRVERPGMFPELLEFETKMKRVTPAPGENLAAAQERIHREFLASCEQRYGPKSSEAAEASFPLAEHLYNQGGVAEGIALMRHAIEIREAALGANAVERTCDLFLLAEFLEREQRFPEAIDLVEQALAIHERASGPDHPDTVLALQRLADLHAAFGHERDAERFVARAVLARTADHPETKPTTLDWPQLFRPHEHCGARLFGEGKVAAATFHFQRAIELRPDLGENHNNMGTAYCALAREAKQRGDGAKEAGLMRQAIAEFTEARRCAPEVPTIGVNLANAMVAAGRYDESATVYVELLEDEPDNAALLNNYGVALYKSGRKQEAIEQFRKALKIDPDLRDAQESLAIALGEDAAEPAP